MNAEHYWIRIRLTPMLKGKSGRICFYLGERDDGGVFYVECFPDKEMGYSVALLSLDQFLRAPLNKKSMGQFDKDPTMYWPGMSPAAL